MIEKFKDYEEIKKAYPKTMSKDQFYKVAHISKATALFLLQTGLVSVAFGRFFELHGGLQDVFVCFLTRIPSS